MKLGSVLGVLLIVGRGQGKRDYEEEGSVGLVQTKLTATRMWYSRPQPWIGSRLYGRWVREIRLEAREGYWGG